MAVSQQTPAAIIPKIDRKKFFDAIRPYLDGSLTAGQVNGLEAMISEFERKQWGDIRWLAYIMATSHHETAKTHEPIEEYGKGHGRDYGKKLDYGMGPGKRVPYSTPDKLFYGRGHTQNTWLMNYKKLALAAKQQGFDWDFVNQPELLLQMHPSIWTIFYAMSTGLYTGRRLNQYFTVGINDPVKARYIINGQDCAEKIAGHHKAYLAALKASVTM